MYVPADGSEATGTIDVSCYELPEVFGSAEYPYFGLSGTLNTMLVDQMWMKDGKQFTGTFQQGETYTLYATLKMSDGSKIPDGAYMTVNGEAPTSTEYVGDLLVVRKDYKVGTLLTFKLPGSLATIEAEAFEGSTAEMIVVPSGCTSIGSRAFADCPNLKYLVINSNSITIADDALEGNIEATGACRVTLMSSWDSDVVSWAKMHGVNWRNLD